MDFDRYAEQMRLYYDRRTDPATEWDGIGYAESFERDYQGAKPSMRELADAICTALAGRDVLELAAGMGQYARFLVRTANSVLTTDATARALFRLDAGVLHGQTLPPGRFKSTKLDANNPDQAPGRFGGALAVNWFQHLPLQQIPDWIERLHRVLLPGARVFIAINHLQPKSRAKLFSKPGDANLYERRETFDGQVIDIIDNVFSQFDLEQLFAPHAMSTKFTCGKGYYWMAYDLRS